MAPAVHLAFLGIQAIEAIVAGKLEPAMSRHVEDQSVAAAGQAVLQAMGLTEEIAARKR